MSQSSQIIGNVEIKTLANGLKLRTEYYISVGRKGMRYTLWKQSDRVAVNADGKQYVHQNDPIYLLNLGKSIESIKRVLIENDYAQFFEMDDIESYLEGSVYGNNESVTKHQIQGLDFSKYPHLDASQFVMTKKYSKAKNKPYFKLVLNTQDNHRGFWDMWREQKQAFKDAGFWVAKTEKTQYTDEYWSLMFTGGEDLPAVEMIEFTTPESGSKHVGEKGERLKEVEVTVKSVDWREGNFGQYAIIKMTDRDGNEFVVMGSSQFAEDREAGEEIKVNMTVKSHSEFKGVKSTQVSRPMLVA